MKRKWYADGPDCLIACICSLTNIHKEKFNVELVKRVNTGYFDRSNYFFLGGYYNSVYQTLAKNGYSLDLTNHVKHKHAIGILRILHKMNHWQARHAVIINKKYQIIHNPSTESLDSGKFIYGLEAIYNLEKL